jgi:hypothetical protein
VYRIDFSSSFRIYKKLNPRRRLKFSFHYTVATFVRACARLMQHSVPYGSRPCVTFCIVHIGSVCACVRAGVQQCNEHRIPTIFYDFILYAFCINCNNQYNMYIMLYNILQFIHSVVCLTTGPKPLPKRPLHIVRSRASSFTWEYPLLSLRSSSSFLRLLPRLPVTSISSFIFPSITCCIL